MTNMTQDAALVTAADREYRKTATIRARQWWQDGDHPAVYLREPLGDLARHNGPAPWCPTLEGGHLVTPGDWIATGVQGEHWPIKPDVFAATYTLAASDHPDERGGEALREAAKPFGCAADRIDHFDGDTYDAPLYAMRPGGALRELLNGREGDDPITVGHLRALRAALSTPAAPEPTEADEWRVPDGWVAVPIEPIREMWAAGGNAVVGYKQRHHDKVVAQVWADMLAARPSLPGGGK